MSAGARPTLSLTLACDNACIFCAQAGLEPSAVKSEDVDAHLEELRAAGHDAVTFTGGEPLLADGLEKIIARASSFGFDEIGLSTNGIRLGSEQGLLERLDDAGLTDLHLSIHGARAEVHDFHTAHPGSFDRALAASSRARRRGLHVVVSTVLTRSNQGVISEMPSLLSRMGVSAWQIALPIARGRAEEAAARILPRLALALPYALHALNRAEKAGVSAFIAGAPLCLLGPMVKHALPSPARSYGPLCEGCAAAETCPGVDATYLGSFGGDELRRRPAPEPTADSLRARLFVGIGQVASAAPASASRRGLAVIH